MLKIFLSCVENTPSSRWPRAPGRQHLSCKWRYLVLFPETQTSPLTMDRGHRILQVLLGLLRITDHFKKLWENQLGKSPNTNRRRATSPPARGRAGTAKSNPTKSGFSRRSGAHNSFAKGIFRTECWRQSQSGIEIALSPISWSSGHASPELLGQQCNHTMTGPERALELC